MLFWQLLTYFQIITRSLDGFVLPGEAGFPEGRWSLDQRLELHNDDALWAYTIRCAGELRRMQGKSVLDPVMFRLFKMGIFDWEKPDDRLAQSVAPMRHATTLGMRLFQRIVVVEQEVSPVR